MPILLQLTAFTSLLLNGAIFGFFYAWICSTMWGLDAADPRTAIAAMQAMNSSVRNIVFAPAFITTPFVLLLAGMVAWRMQLTKSAILFSMAGLVYLFGGLILTVGVNVQMNTALGQVTIPDDVTAARDIWTRYSQPRQVYNILRALASGLALLLTGIGIYLMTGDTAHCKEHWQGEGAAFPESRHSA